jgi:hypothetical protein
MIPALYNSGVKYLLPLRRLAYIGIYSLPVRSGNLLRSLEEM